MKIIRLGTYKTGFTYYKVSGRSGRSGNKVEITDSKEIDKIRALKIPPAYENVTILNNKKIIAFGYDSKNRKQVLYHPSFIAKQNIKKYDKISMASIKFFSKLKRKISEDLDSGSSGSGSGNEKTLATAVIITLILSCGFRIGNKKYEKVNNSVGLTTLKYKHVEFQEKNQKLIIDFIGKKGVRNVAECDNKIIYDYLYQKNKNNMNHSDGDRRDAYVFTYDGSKVISSSDVNEYLRRISEPYSIVITTKDLRTWNANMLFLMYYKKLRKQKQKQKRHSSETAAAATVDVSEAATATATAAAAAADTKDIEKDIKKAIEMVAEKLHNSYSICKKSYIDPKIIEELLEKDKK